VIETLQRLAAARIQILTTQEIATHFVFQRDGFVSLVERAPDDGFGNIGAPGLLTGHGFAVLVWRENEAWFVGKGFEQRAGEGQVAELRSFSRDLEKALRGSE